MKVHLFLVVLSLFFAFGVLGTSLVSASSSSSLSTSLQTSRQIRFSGEVMPGHILYPAQVAREKAGLLLADAKTQCTARIEIADHRLQAAQQLLAADDSALAFETLVKGHHYLADSVNQFQDEKLDTSLKSSLKAALLSYQETILETKAHFPEKEKAILDKTLAENEALLTHLGD